VSADIVFFRFMTLTTVGFGDITPISAEASFVAVFEAVAGVFFLAFLVARLVALYHAEEDSQNLAKQRAGVPPRRRVHPRGRGRARHCLDLSPQAPGRGHQNQHHPLGSHRRTMPVRAAATESLTSTFHPLSHPLHPSVGLFCKVAPLTRPPRFIYLLTNLLTLTTLAPTHRDDCRQQGGGTPREKPTTFRPPGAKESHLEGFVPYPLLSIVPCISHGQQIFCLSGREAEQEGCPVYIRHKVIKGPIDDEAMRR
jgi:Ion channel